MGLVSGLEGRAGRASAVNSPSFVGTPPDTPDVISSDLQVNSCRRASALRTSQTTLSQRPKGSDNQHSSSRTSNFITAVRLIGAPESRSLICSYQSNQTWQLLRTSWQRKKIPIFLVSSPQRSPDWGRIYPPLFMISLKKGR